MQWKLYIFADFFACRLQEHPDNPGCTLLNIKIIHPELCSANVYSHCTGLWKACGFSGILGLRWLGFRGYTVVFKVYRNKNNLLIAIYVLWFMFHHLCDLIT